MELKKSYVHTFVVLLIFISSACAINPAEKHFYREIGVASYYAKSLHGHSTASGERYNMHAFTAAHRKLPFGTVVMVTNLKNNKSVKVKINDRGPFVKGRIIDLSTAAAKKIGLLTEGVAKVKIVALS